LWNNGTMTGLGPSFLPVAVAVAVNDNDQIVANAVDTATGHTHACC
jgi:hypothetical protein